MDNLIQQLQATPKWKEFEEWYNKQDYSMPMEGFREIDYIIGFDDLDFEFQKGVFEKFIESRGFIIEQWYQTSAKQMYVCLFQDAQTVSIFVGTFEELLIWYFNY